MLSFNIITLKLLKQNIMTLCFQLNDKMNGNFNNNVQEQRVYPCWTFSITMTTFMRIEDITSANKSKSRKFLKCLST